MAEGLKNALEALKTAACDLTSQEVQTYTGDLNIQIDVENIDTTRIQNILESVKATGSLKLVAVTRISFDGDGLVLCPEEPLPDHVLKTHQAAIEAGLETRAGLLELFSSIIGLTAD